MSLCTINEKMPGRRFEFVEARQRANFPDIVEPEFWEAVRYCWPYTVLSLPALYNYYSALKYSERAGLRGSVIECGVFFGGSVMFAGRLLREMQSTRPLVAMDTFYGFVRNDPERDVNYAGTEVCKPNRTSNDFYDLARANMEDAGYLHLEIVKGDVAETVPALPVENIAVLRLDTDTYDTTKLELECLYKKVAPGGVVIIDDYGFNQGCARAVNEFLAGSPTLVTRVDGYVRSFQKPY